MGNYDTANGHGVGSGDGYGNDTATGIGSGIGDDNVKERTAIMARKSKLMLRVEEKFKQPLGELLTEKINEQSLSATADELGVSKATLGYWLLKLGINVRRVAVSPGETLEVKSAR